MSEWFPQSQQPREEEYPDQPRQAPARPEPYGYDPPFPPADPAAPAGAGEQQPQYSAAPYPPTPYPPSPYQADPASGSGGNGTAAPDQPFPAGSPLDAPGAAAGGPAGPGAGLGATGPAVGDAGPGAGGDPEWWTPVPASGEQPVTRPPAPAAAAPARSAGLARGLALVAWPALLFGLLVHDNNRDSMLSSVPAWSLFAVLCLVLVAIGAFAPGPGPSRNWTLGAVGAGGLLMFWVLLVLPAIASNTAFALTLAAAAGAAAIWLAPARQA